MAVPKTKVSKSKLRMRKAAWNSKVPRTAPTACPECGAPRQPHRVCPSCGKYDGRQVLVVSDED
ncbi:MAG: 50S ribosomal protein L32 [Kiritimatiellae bacterium]|jgi:large subunit ribosomal protein L32|nr:50S ribosomal protein L32 [Kiritimatiellia bacterium]